MEGNQYAKPDERWRAEGVLQSVRNINEMQEAGDDGMDPWGKGLHIKLRG